LSSNECIHRAGLQLSRGGRGYDQRGEWEEYTSAPSIATAKGGKTGSTRLESGESRFRNAIQRVVRMWMKQWFPVETANAMGKKFMHEQLPQVANRQLHAKAVR
jgi:hypothetical protein